MATGANQVDEALLRRLPKVELHNHLDGGLRVGTILELAADLGYRQLPAWDEAALAEWFFQGDAGSLEQYLAGFVHTVAVMQTPDAMERVAFEAVEDLAKDGVLYGEIRFAPFLNTQLAMRREDAIEAAIAGFRRGFQTTGTLVQLIVSALRNRDDTREDALAAVHFADQGVVAFDLAGPESGYPADAHAEACRVARAGGLRTTIHAGEAAGPESIAAALSGCGAERIGHGVQIVNDISESGELGPVAKELLDRQIPLEVCPTSNMQTLGITAESHPLGRLYRLGLNVTLNTDNRLMSGVTLTDEFALAVTHHDFDLDDLEVVTTAAAEAAFVDDTTRNEAMAAIRAGYASLSSNHDAT